MSSWHSLPGLPSLPPVEEVSYVEVRPMTNLESLRAKSEALALRGARAEDRLRELAPGDAKADVEPPKGKRTAKKLRRLEREKTKGPGWFGMAAPELTDQTKRDLEVLQMRSALDPKRFYKKNDLSTLPKYFQVGKVLDSPADYYTDRVPQKARKSTLVDELMADAEFQRYNKRKYAEILEEKSKTQRKYQGKKGKKKMKAS